MPTMGMGMMPQTTVPVSILFVFLFLAKDPFSVLEIPENHLQDELKVDLFTCLFSEHLCFLFSCERVFIKVYVNPDLKYM